MKRMLKNLLIKFLKIVPTRRVILLESIPILGDNTGALFHYMINEKWNEKYKLIWVARYKSELKNIPKTKNVSYISRDNRLDGMKLFIYRCFAAAIVDCNAAFPKLNPKTVHIYLTHGSPIKSVVNYKMCTEDTDWIVNQAEFFTDANVYNLHVSNTKLVKLGFPRNDVLLERKTDLKAIFGEQYNKFVVWYPTYRQRKNSSVKVSSISIPVIHDIAAAEEINKKAEEQGVLIIVKPHPAQELSFINSANLSNVKFIDDSFFAKHKIKAYEFLASTDALITDYSSVFYDYLLTDKPVALTFEDADQYSENPGFAIDVDIIKTCSYMLDSPKDFEKFFADLSSGNDPLFEERMKIKKLTNYYLDGNSSKRVADFIKRKIENTHPLK